MGYDYSKQFLVNHDATVKQLIQLADSGGVIQLRHEDPSVLKGQRVLVSNLLASLALNYPEQAYVRQRVRTWVDYDNGIWVLNIGQTTQKLTGRRPLDRTKPLAPIIAVPSALSMNMTPIAQQYTHPQVVQDEGSYASFVGKVLELPASVTNVRANFAPPIENTEMFEELFEGWKVTLDNNNETLVLSR